MSWREIAERAPAAVSAGAGEVLAGETADAPEIWRRAGAPFLAVRRADGDGARAGVVYLQGLASDMEGMKAVFCEYVARSAGRCCLRQDYRGLGAAEGDYLDGTIGDWFGDARDCFDAFTEGSQVVVGSSMGGWFAVLMALQRPSRVRGLVLLAPALDFTELLIKPNLTSEQRADLERDGFYERAPGMSVGRALLESGSGWCILGGDMIELGCPVRIIHGALDEAVPWDHAVRTADSIRSPDLRLERIHDGGHRLSRPQDLLRLSENLRELL
ncbi:MAG: alpha/beta hydrolase [Alphaproteobacteria bacterium]|nr:alpha/beta hydrolase [Alphaproteobacteria bacterium]MDA8001486.1 alpha/beta hydrolase [Alphaproteobacteria bacterium]MDA8003700.1 alpha/beta hydrolase [Alphaproteobacteria bacterium]MDA8006031.1 alpha/beta hydrolase [Alphaproteobacteria bacterium]MDA8013794.1 alpha/beta hydrolase [Alphaproteobacteria bacterium]